jgi:hypothetical protein
MSPRTSIIILSLSALLSINLFSQQRKPVPAFATLDLGVLNTDREHFSDTYNSSTGFVVGGGLGLQVSSSVAIVVKATYFHKSGVPLVRTYNYSILTGTTTLVSQKKEGTASYTQWLLNAGLQFALFDVSTFGFSANGGVLYSVVSEEQDASPDFSYSSDGKGIYGYFLGLNVEGDIPELPISPFAEVQYNFTRSGIVQAPQPAGGHFGGLNISLGAKYYFHK